MSWEEACMVSLANNEKRDLRVPRSSNAVLFWMLFGNLEFCLYNLNSTFDLGNFLALYHSKLAFADTVPIKDVVRQFLRHVVVREGVEEIIFKTFHHLSTKILKELTLLA
jgi:hypothetical protein